MESIHTECEILPSLERRTNRLKIGPQEQKGVASRSLGWGMAGTLETVWVESRRGPAGVLFKKLLTGSMQGGVQCAELQQLAFLGRVPRGWLEQGSRRPGRSGALAVLSTALVKETETVYSAARSTG